MSAGDYSFLARVRRNPYPFLCLFLTLCLGIGAWYLRARTEMLEAEHAERSQEGEAMLKLLVGASTQKAELAMARETARRIEDNLIVETNLAENHWYFFKLEEQTKAKLVEVHQLTSPINDASTLFKRIPYAVRVSGTYEQVAAFLLALETGPRLVSVVGFGFTRQTNGDLLSLELSLELLGKK